MTQDEIIAMAREACMEEAVDGLFYATSDSLQRFAALVAAPEGWQLVPVEPTSDMMCAAWDSTPAQMDDMTDGDFGQAYKNMLAAAPKP